MELVLSMSGITIALFLVTKQIAVLLTGGALLLCAIVGIFVLTQAFGSDCRSLPLTCQTLDHMIAGNEAPQRPEDIYDDGRLFLDFSEQTASLNGKP